ncbi:hypothetical protein [Methylobacterium tardum]|uniref:hypothetical protein n=1 Tax=Methylobacterium tardum TaxID=374432 RepID=UPI00202279C1|nr:hypothetical protein [Methylobacterium tardum]URD36560.1 hypothetical protein M6G65_30185 [Methylobacterium tardum]
MPPTTTSRTSLTSGVRGRSGLVVRTCPARVTTILKPFAPSKRAARAPQGCSTGGAAAGVGVPACGVDGSGAGLGAAGAGAFWARDV